VPEGPGRLRVPDAPQWSAPERACPQSALNLLPSHLIAGHEVIRRARAHAPPTTITATAGNPRVRERLEWEDDMVEVNRTTTAGEHALEARRSCFRCLEPRGRLVSLKVRS